MKPLKYLLGLVASIALASVSITSPTVKPAIGGPIAGGLDGSILFVNPDGIFAQNNTSFKFDPGLQSLLIQSLDRSSGANAIVIRVIASLRRSIVLAPMIAAER